MIMQGCFQPDNNVADGCQPPMRKKTMVTAACRPHAETAMMMSLGIPKRTNRMTMRCGDVRVQEPLDSLLGHAAPLGIVGAG